MKRISRRAILRGAAGAAIALPWLEAMSPRRARAAASPKRFIVMFSPNGTLPTQWFRYAFGRSEQTSGDLCAISALASTLTGPGGDFKQMVRQTVRMAAFRNLPPEAP